MQPTQLEAQLPQSFVEIIEILGGWQKVAGRMTGIILPNYELINVLRCSILLLDNNFKMMSFRENFPLGKDRALMQWHLLTFARI